METSFFFTSDACALDAMMAAVTARTAALRNMIMIFPVLPMWLSA
jgi:hypothetical protein